MKKTLLEIDSLLAECSEKEWKKSFDFFIQQLDRDGEHTVKKLIRPIFGGMCSFNDLILYRDGNISHEKNIRMASLRSELFGIISKP